MGNHHTLWLQQQARSELDRPRPCADGGEAAIQFTPAAGEARGGEGDAVGGPLHKRLIGLNGGSAFLSWREITVLVNL